MSISAAIRSRRVRLSVTVPSASRVPDRAPAAEWAPAARDRARWAARAAPGSAATDRAAPALVARPAAEVWTTLAWTLTTRAAGPRNRGLAKTNWGRPFGRPQSAATE